MPWRTTGAARAGSRRGRRAAGRQTALDFSAQEFVDLENDALEDVGEVDLVFDVLGGDIAKRSAGVIRAGGTLVTIAGFVPVGFAKSGAGEYCFSLFAVVAIALVVSWIVAVLFTPLTGVALLPDRTCWVLQPEPLTMWW